MEFRNFIFGKIFIQGDPVRGIAEHYRDFSCIAMDQNSINEFGDRKNSFGDFLSKFCYLNTADSREHSIVFQVKLGSFFGLVKVFQTVKGNNQIEFRPVQGIFLDIDALQYYDLWSLEAYFCKSVSGSMIEDHHGNQILDFKQKLTFPRIIDLSKEIMPGTRSTLGNNRYNDLSLKVVGGSSIIIGNGFESFRRLFSELDNSEKLAILNAGVSFCPTKQYDFTGWDSVRSFCSILVGSENQNLSGSKLIPTNGNLKDFISFNKEVEDGGGTGGGGDRGGGGGRGISLNDLLNELNEEKVKTNHLMDQLNGLKKTHSDLRLEVDEKDLHLRDLVESKKKPKKYIFILATFCIFLTGVCLVLWIKLKDNDQKEVEVTIKPDTNMVGKKKDGNSTSGETSDSEDTYVGGPIEIKPSSNGVINIKDINLHIDRLKKDVKLNLDSFLVRKNEVETKMKEIKVKIDSIKDLKSEVKGLKNKIEELDKKISEKNNAIVEKVPVNTVSNTEKKNKEIISSINIIMKGKKKVKDITADEFERIKKSVNLD